jgi:hypothetical protein
MDAKPKQHLITEHLKEMKPQKTEAASTKVIQKVSSDGLLKKKTRIYFQTIYIAI